MEEYKGWSTDNADRIRRAESWHERARKEQNLDEKFIFLWIAFNAAYGGYISTHTTTAKKELEQFLEKLHDRDRENLLQDIVYQQCDKSIDNLIKNKYALSAFWENMRSGRGGHIRENNEWNNKLKRDNKKIYENRENGKACEVLKGVLWRIYTTRNQIFHGGMTHPEGFGHTQIKDSVDIMKALVPAILKIIINDIDKEPKTIRWGRVKYPRYRDTPE